MIQVKRLGHATFATPDLDGQVGYYSDVLGLSVVERDRNRAFVATATGLEAIALERGDAVALTPLQYRSPLRQFRGRSGAPAPSHRLRGQGLAGDPSVLRFPGPERHPPGLGT